MEYTINTIAIENLILGVINMKLFKKIATVFLMLTLAITSVNALPVKAATTSENVKLSYARKMPYSHGNILHFVIKVKNLGYNKKVQLKDVATNRVLYTDAEYYSSNNDGTENWVVRTNPLNKDPNFYISYEVNGKTYIDNNNGKNYSFGKNDSILNDNPVLFTCSLNGGWSNIVVKNLGYNKNIGIRYSEDNWATFRDIPASYRATSSDNTLDYWFVVVPGDGEYAVYYEVNGVKYWDNNHNNNYSGSVYDI